MRKLRRKLSAGGFNDELRPIAKGRAQFMLGHSKGKTRGLLNLYDTGCGGVLFREGVPQHELAPAVLTTKGPFYVKGVGDTTVKVNDEFMCTMRLRDGTRQVLEGFTVDKITATLPFVNLATAESELKADKKENKELQELKCQPEVGGDCDILVGLMYSNIFPVAVHSLSNGLTIYKLKVTPHDDRYDSVIGGPHESFQYMATQFGSMSIVFANLCQQLGNYQELGPPKISRAIMTVEDEEFAKRFKEWEIENLDVEDIDLNINLDPLHNKIEPTVEMEEIDSEPAPEDSGGQSTETEDETVTLCCVECGREGMTVKLNAFTSRPGEIDEEHQQVLKRLQQAQQEGLNIDYRCPKCRSCSDCRRSFATERVSQREEAEDVMI